MRSREADVLRAVLDYLAAKRIFHLRLNSGMFVLGEGKSRRAFKGVRPGCADVIVLKGIGYCCYEALRHCVCTDPPSNYGAYFLECKTQSGRQSPAQKAFQSEVESQGMKYAIVRSIEDLKALGL